MIKCLAAVISKLFRLLAVLSLVLSLHWLNTSSTWNTHHRLLQSYSQTFQHGFGTSIDLKRPALLHGKNNSTERILLDSIDIKKENFSMLITGKTNVTSFIETKPQRSNALTNLIHEPSSQILKIERRVQHPKRVQKDIIIKKDVVPIDKNKEIRLWHVKINRPTEKMEAPNARSKLMKMFKHMRKSKNHTLLSRGSETKHNVIAWTMPPIEDLSISSQIREFIKEPIINPHNYDYAYNPLNLCDSKRENKANFLFVIPSAPENFRKRREVRQFGIGSYGKLGKARYNIRVAFFLGSPDVKQKYPNPRQTQLLVEEEAAKYGDIVQEKFPDVYSNIRLKAVSMLKWASTYCTHVNYVIRIDDDVLVSPDAMIKTISEVGRQYDNFILGDVKSDFKPVRDLKDKYYVSEEEYADDVYPSFALGGLLGYPLKTVRLLYEATLRVRPIWLDDVYVTGICAPKVGAKLLSHRRFTFLH